MNKNQSAQKIMKMLSLRHHCTVEELEHELRVSAPTMYCDVDDLTMRNPGVKNHGTIELPTDESKT